MLNVAIYSRDIKMVADALIILKQRCEHMMIHYTDNPKEFLLYSSVCTLMDIVIIDMATDKEAKIAHRLKVYNEETHLIFISDNKGLLELMVNSEPFRYIPKAGMRGQLIEAIETSITRKSKKKPPLFFEYERNRSKHLVNLNRVLYFYSDRRLVCCKEKDGVEQDFYGKLDDVEDQVSKRTNMFIRVSSSYYVNKKYIVNVAESEIFMVDNSKIKVTRKYQKGIDYP